MEETETNKQEEQKPEEKKPSVIESAKEAADRLEKENERMETNIKKLEELKAIETISGKTDAAEKTEEKKEETPREYAKRISEGRI